MQISCSPSKLALNLASIDDSCLDHSSQTYLSNSSLPSMFATWQVLYCKQEPFLSLIHLSYFQYEHVDS